MQFLFYYHDDKFDFALKCIIHVVKIPTCRIAPEGNIIIQYGHIQSHVCAIG